MIFSKDSLWNKPAEMLDDKPSTAIINSCTDPKSGKPIPFGLSMSDYSVPVFKASWWSTKYLVKVDHPEWGCPQLVSARIPRDAEPATGTDHHMTIIDGNFAHDFWDYKGAIKYRSTCGFYRKWDLTGSGTAPVWTAGCRASGAPLLAGLVTWKDAMSGTINHPLALAVPFIADKTIIPPASATQKGNVDDIFLAMGQRIMLDPAYALPLRLPAEIRIIIETLQTYGAIVVDVSKTPVFYLEDLEHSPNKWWFNNSILSALPLESLRIAK